MEKHGCTYSDNSTPKRNGVTALKSVQAVGCGSRGGWEIHWENCGRLLRESGLRGRLWGESRTSVGKPSFLRWDVT